MPKRYALSLISVLSLILSSDVVSAQFEDGGVEYKWKTAASNYLDPASFFSLHGYVESVYASFSRDWTRADGAKVPDPGQVLVPNSNTSSFQYEGAIVIASEINPQTRLMMEIHLVSDPSGTGTAGPGGLTVILTEAVATYDFIPDLLSASFGQFWAPFGIVNQDWLGAQNLFALLPRASAAFPSHWNERGIRLDGVKAFSDSFAVNYVGSYGNGVKNYAISGQTSSDPNQNKTVMGRIGVFPGLGSRLEVGYSVAAGRLRQGEDPSQAVSSLTRYPATLEAHGVDLVARIEKLKIRSYAIHATEKLGAITATGNTLGSLERTGFMVETSYPIDLKGGWRGITTIKPKARFDWVTIEDLSSGGQLVGSHATSVYSLGFGAVWQQGFEMSFEYHVQNEHGRRELSDNRFVARAIVRF
ncbi:MAG: hypothetical protein COB53_08395 [Elusimicrobia bacterium]|nr:MAG: hypothetical protein COB53_08395 [Elusimicrobiota bacterium]